MAIKKDTFAKYAASRENAQLSKAMEAKKYKHHRVFDNLDSSDENESETIKVSLLDEEKLCELDPSQVENWLFHDRPQAELGDIDALARDLKLVGQQQPCIVRPSSQKNNQYELIIGERRWRAAQKAGLKLKVIVRKMDDSQAALAQAAENDNRTDLSDYAKGIQFSKLIEKGIIKQKDLIETLGKSKQYVSRLLSFVKIPVEIIEAIGIHNMKNISANTAEWIKQQSEKSQKHVDTIIELANKISTGKFGHVSLNRLLNEKIEKRSEKEPSINCLDRKIHSNDGRHIFTWRTDNNKLPSIHFPKNIVNVLFSSDEEKLKCISERFVQIIEDELKSIKSPSGGTFSNGEKTK